MKTFIFCSLFALPSFAATFECRYLYNLSEIYSSEVTVADGARDVKIAELGEYEFFMSSFPDGKYEFQALNVYEPSRTYASARMSSANPEINIVIWKREGIMEGSCKLQSN